MITSWADYLSPPLDANALHAVRDRLRSDFRHQRTTILKIFNTRKPNVVACLGAGFLNDIPYTEFIETGVTLHLVDWTAGITDIGIAQSILRERGEKELECIYCHLTGVSPTEYCTAYRRDVQLHEGVCDAFARRSGAGNVCDAFQKGDLPHLHRQDVTGGYASAFGEALGDELRNVTSWRQALKAGIALANRIKASGEKLAIEGGSVDLVLSSMVMSQFEHEPYGYFSKRVTTLLGLPSRQEEKRLQPEMERLRSILLENQIKGHCEEILRILALNGRCFMAFEMMHNSPGKEQWYLVDQMQTALCEIARYFDFDVDGCPQPVAGNTYDNESGRSVVYQLLLQVP